MRKILIVLIAAVLIFTVMTPKAFSQSFGILAGINLANMSGDDVEDQFGMAPENKMGLAAGGFMLYNFSDNLAFRPEILYSQLGAKAEEAGVEVSLNAVVIQVPLLLQYSFSSGGSFAPFILVGPYLSYLLSADVAIEGGGFSMDMDIKDDVKDIDFGVMFGVGAAINNKIEISARYQMGLQTMDDTDAEADIKNKTIQILAGIRL